MDNGWIETGVRSFSNAEVTDVIFRTDTLSNRLILGNSTGYQSGLVIDNNNIGVQRNPQCELDIIGTFRNSFNPHVTKITASNVKLFYQNKESHLISTTGVNKNVATISSLYKTLASTLSNVYIYEGSTYQEHDEISNEIGWFHNLTVDDHTATHIAIDQFFLTDERLFQLHDFWPHSAHSNLYTLKCQDHSLYASLPFQLRNEFYTFHTLEDPTEKSMLKDDHVTYAFQLQTFQEIGVTKRTVEITGAFVNQNWPAKLLLGSYVSFRSLSEDTGTLDNVWYLSKIRTTLDKFICLNLEKVFQHNNVTLNKPDHLYDILILDTIKCPLIKDDAFIFNKSDTQKEKTCLISAPNLYNIVLKNQNNFIPFTKLALKKKFVEVVAINSSPNENQCTVDFATTNHMVSGKTTIEFFLIGFTIDVSFVKIINTRTIRFYGRDVNNLGTTHISSFRGEYILVHDFYTTIWVLKSIDFDDLTDDVIITLISVDNVANLDEFLKRSQRRIYVRPFRLRVIKSLDEPEHDFFHKGKVGIRTEKLREDLTVDGSMSVTRDIRFYDNNNKDSVFGLGYKALHFDIGKFLDICVDKENSWTHSSTNSLFVEGQIQTSDKVIAHDFLLCPVHNKKQGTVQNATPDKDLLDKIRNIPIEQHVDGSRNMNLSILENVFPGLIHNSTMFVKNVDRVVTFLSKNECFLATPSTLDLIQVGTTVKLSIRTLDKFYWIIAKITNLIYKPAHGYVLVVDRDLENGSLYLYGTLCESKTLDTYQTITLLLDVMQRLSKLELLRLNNNS